MRLNNVNLAIDTFNVAKGMIYKHEIDNIIDYMKNIRQWKNDDMMFDGIKTVDIIESLKYNIINAHYNTKSIAKKYSVAVSEFFLYSINNEYINNPYFYNELVGKRLDDKSYYNKINIYIAQEQELNEPERDKAFTKQDIDLLINECNYFFVNNVNQQNINEMAACICIKLMILLGFKYSIVHNIKFNDFDGDCLLIKGYKIYLPITLNKQINNYKSLVKNTFNKEPDMMFLKNNGKPWGSKTYPVAYQLSKITGTNSTTRISKFGIINLLNADVSSNVISELTDAKDTYINDCIEQMENIYKDKYINSRISKIDYFYTL